MNQQQILTMLEMQERMNQRVHPDWRNQGFEWYRAIWVECAELMDHYGWKWWKKQLPDMAQVHLELIDIWHFGMSHLLSVNEGSLEALAAAISTELSEPADADDFRAALECFTEWTLTHRAFKAQWFGQLLAAGNLPFDELYTGYIGKNVLNFFRQDHGYQEGTYQKNWGGKEDNEHLAELSASLDCHSSSYKDDLYQALSARYESLKS